MIRIVEAVFQKSAVKPIDYYPTPYLEIAVAGKSNVGKSSLINTLLNRRNIAKVSSTPGKTKLINFFEVRVKLNEDDPEKDNTGFFSLADLPGYGYAKVSKDERERWKTMVDNYLSLRGQLRAVFLLIDIRHAGDEKDKMMLDLLRFNEIPYFLICTKADKIGKNEITKNVKRLSQDLDAPAAQFIPFSSLKRTGLERLLQEITQSIFT